MGNFLKFYILYCIFSVLLAFPVSPALLILAIFFLLIPLYLISILLYAILFAILYSKKKIVIFNTYFKLMFLIAVVVQFFALLFNVITCPPWGPNTYNFIQTLTQPNMFDSYGFCLHGLKPIFPNAHILWVIYATLLIALPVYIFIISLKVHKLTKSTRRK